MYKSWASDVPLLASSLVLLAGWVCGSQVHIYMWLLNSGHTRGLKLNSSQLLEP